MPLFPPQDYRKTEFTHRIGLAAARPAAADVLIGTLYFSTDTLVLERSNGITWASYSPSGGGSPGPQGPQGYPGIDGVDGQDGLDGINGVAGAQGIPGIQGIQGLIGQQGLDGLDGEDGFSIPGPIGPVGNTGLTGNTGEAGPIGPPGIDAEELEYPYIIPGERGATGPAGSGGGGSAATVEVNLSATATWRGKFTITDAGITGTSKVLAWQAPGPYTGKGTRSDEAEMQPVSIIAVAPGAGSAVVMWQTPPYLTDKKLSRMQNGTLTSIPKDSQAVVTGVATRLGKVRGNVKFSYVVFS